MGERVFDEQPLAEGRTRVVSWDFGCEVPFQLRFEGSFPLFSVEVVTGYTNGERSKRRVAAGVTEGVVEGYGQIVEVIVEVGFAITFSAALEKREGLATTFEPVRTLDNNLGQVLPLRVSNPVIVPGFARFVLVTAHERFPTLHEPANITVIQDFIEYPLNTGNLVWLPAHPSASLTVFNRAALNPVFQIAARFIDKF